MINTIQAQTRSLLGRPIKDIRILIASMLGQMLEFYDFTLTAVSYNLLSKEFFPATDNALWLDIRGILLISVGYLSRPVGGWYFGIIGDRDGRTKSLAMSMLYMGCVTTALGLLPTFALIGYLAPIIFIILRFLQGVSMGGEGSGSFIYVMEIYKERPIFIQSLLIVAMFAGIALASLVFEFSINYLQPLFAARNYSLAYWRVPFLSSALLALVGSYVRSKLRDSKEYLQYKAERTSFIGFFELMRGELRIPFIMIFLLLITTLSIGASSINMHMFLRKYSLLPLNESLGLFKKSALITCVMTIICALLYEKFLFKSLVNAIYICIPLSILSSCIAYFCLTGNRMSIYMGMMLLSVGVILPSLTINHLKYLLPIGSRFRLVLNASNLAYCLIHGTYPFFYNYVLQYRAGFLFPSLVTLLFAVPTLWFLRYKFRTWLQNFSLTFIKKTQQKNI